MRSYFVLNIDNNDDDYDHHDDGGGGSDDGGGDDDDDENDCDGDRLIGRHYIRFHWVKYFSKHHRDQLNFFGKNHLEQVLISDKFDQNFIEL